MARPASSSTARAGARRRPANRARGRSGARRRGGIAARRERSRRRRVVLIVVLAFVAGVAVGAVAASVIGGSAASVMGMPTSGSGDAPDSASVAGMYDEEQRENASIIIAAGRDLGLSVRDQAIGVMTALGESSLRNIDYGDWETTGVTNPDGSRTTSIGLFQQQDGWGSREERLDPYTSATLFYRAMVARVPDRDALAPTTVAHRTQINRDSDHYARSWSGAVALVEEISGEVSGLAG